jgi:hypothetical protein
MNGEHDQGLWTMYCGDCQQYGWIVITIEFTDDELVLLRNALHSFLTDFGHDEADVITRIQQLLRKLALAQQQAPGAEHLDKAVI